MRRRNRYRQSHGAVPASLRCRTCLHEAGHVVAAQRLLRDSRIGAVVVGEVEGTFGLAYIDAHDSPQRFDEVLCIAVGRAGEALVEFFPCPPAKPSPSPLVRAATPPDRSCYAGLCSDLRGSPPDAARIARWCCHGCAASPLRWAKRHAWIQYEADRFDHDHAHAIAKVATALYVDGVFIHHAARTGTNKRGIK